MFCMHFVIRVCVCNVLCVMSRWVGKQKSHRHHSEPTETNIVCHAY